ncbi:MAG: PAS domain S-box protein [Archaeoglobus sp.]|nr:PAS domain S-box protein [Archaeoglobus sp.]
MAIPHLDFERILDNVRAGIYIFKDGKFIYVNKTIEEISGYSKHEFSDLDPFLLLHPRDRERISEYSEMAFRGENPPDELELRIIRKDGSMRWIAFRPVVLENRLILGTVFDITEMKEVKKRLEESEKVFRVLAENAISGIFIFQDDKFVYVNPIVERLTGYKREEFLKMNFWDLVHPEMKETVKERGRKRQKGERVEPSVYEIPYLTKQGELRWGIFSFSSTVYKGRPAGFCIVNDITENKLLEKRLKESEERFREFSEESLQGILVIQDGKIVYSNKVMEVTGYKRDELIGKRLVELIPKKFRKVANKAYTDAMNGKKVTNVELKYITKGGDEGWALVNAVKINYNGKKAVLSNIIDITERKRLEMQIKKSEEKFRNLWNSVEDIVVVIDAEGRIRECNRKALEVSGLKREELIGKRISDFVSGEWIERIKELIKGEKGPERVEVLASIDGKKLWIEATANIIYDGEPLLHVIGRDITERKRMEEVLKESENKFRSLVERSVAGVYLIQDGVLKYVNPKLAEICGFEAEELINKKVTHVIHPDYRELVENNIRKRLSGESVAINYTLKIMTKDGGVRDVEAYGSRAVIGGKPAIIGTLIDVTELRKSEEKYRKIFSNSSVLIAIVNEFGIVVDCNPAMERSVGRNPIGKSFFDLFPKEVAERRLKHLRQALESNRNVSFIDNNDGYFYTTFIPLELPEGKFCLAMVEDVTDLMNLNMLLKTINEISNIIVHETDCETILRRIRKKLSNYQCQIIWRKGGRVKVLGDVNCDKLRLSISYPVEITTELFMNGFRVEGEEKLCMDCEKACPVKENSHIIILPLFDTVSYGTLILFKKEKPFENELEMLKTMANDIAFALRSLELAEQKRKAYRQINKNIEYFAYLLDAIRNPLMVIAGLAEIDDSENSKLILEQVERIDEIIRNLDKGWIETEEVRNYLNH